ncbi:unnamed protein product [Brassica oleracea]
MKIPDEIFEDITPSGRASWWVISWVMLLTSVPSTRL